MSSALRLGVLASLALAACTSGAPGPPSVISVSPSQTAEGRTIDVQIIGRNFVPDAHASFRSGGLSLGNAFQALLGEHSLDGVQYVDREHLSATVPDDLPSGAYTLRVVDPRGESSNEVSRAFSVLPPCDAGIGAEGCSCNYLDSTEGVCAAGGLFDGSGECSTAPAGYEATEKSCDDLDNDCDGVVDGGCDDDGDGYCDATMEVAAPTASCPNSKNGPGDDCVDAGAGAAQINPAAEEICTGGIDENCNGWIDDLEPSCGGGNTPPIPSILVTPGAGNPNQTYTADATGTTDREDLTADLAYAWDWENDGTVDDTGVTAEKSDFAVGTHTVVLQVTDTDGATGYASFVVVVADVASILEVTTAVDESDAETLSESWLGTGLSLREAIVLANGPLSGTLVTIFVPSEFTIELGSPLPTSQDPAGLRVVGDGATLDCSNLGTAPCIELVADNTAYFGLSLTDCPSDAVAFSDGDGNQVSRTTIERCGGVSAVDAAVRFDHPGTFGPDNVVRDSGGNGVYVTENGDGAVIEGNRIVGSAKRAVRVVEAERVAVRRNILLRNDSDGVALTNPGQECTVTHNTIHGNQGDGIEMSDSSTGLDIRNNIISNNTGAPLFCPGGSFPGSILDRNGYWENGEDCTCCASSVTDNSLSADPAYVDRAGGDLRLLQASPMIDAGADTGLDVNGPEPERWNGAAPDIGAWESP